MKISVIMVDGNFRESFHLIDFLNNQTLPREDYEIIWVEFYGGVKDGLTNKKGAKVITLDNPVDAEYHSSRCFNEGIRKAKGDILVIPDADIVVEPSFLESAYREHKHCERLVMYYYRWDEPEKLHNKYKSYNLEYLKSVCGLKNPANYGGCLTVRKKWLLEINGYEEDPAFSSGFHANGYDVYIRLKNLGLHVMWYPTQKIYHPWHSNTLAASERYKKQISVINKRQLNLSILPNYGLDTSKNKTVKDISDQDNTAGKKGFMNRTKRILMSYLSN